MGEKSNCINCTVAVNQLIFKNAGAYRAAKKIDYCKKGGWVDGWMGVKIIRRASI